MKNKKGFNSSSDVLHSLLVNGKSPLAHQFLRWNLWRNWKDVVGETLSKSTMPVSYLKGTLYIWVKTSTDLQQMSFYTEQLKKKINVYVGSEWVRSIRLTLDRKQVPMNEENAQDLHDFLSKQFPNEGGER